METAAPAGLHSESARILIVDDEPSLLKMMSIYLQRLGYRVTTFDRTEQVSALSDAEISGFAVAVLDATMAGIAMEEVALRLLEANRSIRVLAASGYPVDMSGLEAEAPGRVAFLHKPFTPEMLAVRLRRMIASDEKTGI